MVFLLSARFRESRPFQVQTVRGLVRALGTRFSVYTDNKRSRVDVLEHATRITPGAKPENSLRLEGDYQASFDRQHVTPPRETAASQTS